MQRLAAPAALTALVLAAALSGCAAGDGASDATCTAAVAGITPAPETEGILVLVGEELASTLNACPTSEAWMAALRAHPEVLSLDELSAPSAEEYFAQACSFLNEGPAICDER